MSANPLHRYDPLEEQLNAWTHAAGVVLAILATVLLLSKAWGISTLNYAGLVVYSASMILLFLASSLYHFSQDEHLRVWYKRLDHTAIYYLIAGTYTPFLTIAIPTPKAQYLLIALWVIAGIGTLFKLVFIHRFQKISLIAYLVMGWLALLLIEDMRLYLEQSSLQLLIAGGLAYTIGAIFYALKKVKYTHAIWHVFVLVGAGLHFLSIYLYLI